MKKYLSTLKRNAGFTLIELLVVIGILGILASALVATIDPFEQVNKATDATVKNTLVEYLTANIRYYTNHQTYPWGSGAVGTPCNGTTPPDSLKLCTGSPCVVTDCITALVNDSELKASFTSAKGTLEKIYVTYWEDSTGTNVPTLTENANTLVGCFLPVSKSGQKDAATKWSADGDTLGTDCISTGGVTNCYWCSK